MWFDLWEEFKAHVDSVRSCQDRGLWNSINYAAWWQTQGNEPYVLAPIPSPHLPELYSGAPWLPGSRDHLPASLPTGWIAIVGLNPSLAETEDFPHVDDYQGQESLDILVPFFENRFRTRSEKHPHRHGRDPQGRPVWWTANDRPSVNKTWYGYDKLLQEVAQLAGVPIFNPLG